MTIVEKQDIEREREGGREGGGEGGEREGDVNDAYMETDNR